MYGVLGVAFDPPPQHLLRPAPGSFDRGPALLGREGRWSMVEHALLAMFVTQEDTLITVVLAVCGWYLGAWIRSLFKRREP